MRGLYQYWEIDIAVGNDGLIPDDAVRTISEHYRLLYLKDLIEVHDVFDVHLNFGFGTADGSD